MLGGTLKVYCLTQPRVASTLAGSPSRRSTYPGSIVRARLALNDLHHLCWTEILWVHSHSHHTLLVCSLFLHSLASPANGVPGLGEGQLYELPHWMSLTLCHTQQVSQAIGVPLSHTAQLSITARALYR